MYLASYKTPYFLNDDDDHGRNIVISSSVEITMTKTKTDRSIDLKSQLITTHKQTRHLHTYNREKRKYPN